MLCYARYGGFSGPPVSLATLNLTAGMGFNIHSDEIKSQLGVRFEVNSDLGKAPSPQFVIDGLEFDYRSLQTRTTPPFKLSLPMMVMASA